MSILVIGGTGTVGSQTVRELLRRGARVRVLTRSGEKARALPRGAQGAVGDLERRDSLEAACRGAEKVFLITPLSPVEARLGINAVEAARAAGVRHVVFLSVFNVDAGAHIPHFKSKVEIHAALKASGLPWTLIMPNNFYQNDLFLKDAIVGAGIYPQPLGGVGVSRVDVRDIAEAAANVLTGGGHEGKSYPLAGPEPLTGESVAAAYGRALGRPVKYAGDDLERWGEAALRALPDWLVRDLKVMYRFFQERGLRATAADLARVEQVLGHPPRPFDAFARELAAGGP